MFEVLHVSKYVGRNSVSAISLSGASIYYLCLYNGSEGIASWKTDKNGQNRLAARPFYKTSAGYPSFKKALDMPVSIPDTVQTQAASEIEVNLLVVRNVIIAQFMSNIT